MISKIKRWLALLWWKEGKIAPIGVPYRIPTLAEVEQVKAAEQARKELEFMSDVQQGVAAICKKLHKGETSFIVTHSTGYSEGWILFYYSANKRYMAEVNHILNRSGWQVEITPVGHHPIDKYPVSVEVIVSRTDKEE